MNIRKIALHGLLRVLEEGAWLNKILTHFLFKVQDERDRGLLTELLYGTVKQKLRLDWTISKFLKKYYIEELPPSIRNILRLGAYEIFFLDIPSYATVNEYVKLAKKVGHRGTAALVNALLRRISSERPEPQEPWVRYSHPKWLYERWKQRMGEEECIRLMKYNNSPHIIFIRINTLKVTPSDFEKELKKSGVNFERLYFPETLRIETPPQFLPIDESSYLVQDLSTQIAVHYFNPEPHSTILDMTAAPGVKTTHISQLTSDTAWIVAVEKNKARSRLIKELGRRMGIKNIDIVVGDSAYIPFKHRFQFILLDAPCTGLGTLRRKPEIKWRIKEDDIHRMSALQKKLLENAARLVKKGGFILYSTCTIEPEENGENIKYFLHKFTDFKLVMEKHIPENFVKNGFLFIEGIKYNCDYFFGAKLQKVR